MRAYCLNSRALDLRVIMKINEGILSDTVRGSCLNVVRAKCLKMLGQFVGNCEGILSEFKGSKSVDIK